MSCVRRSASTIRRRCWPRPRRAAIAQDLPLTYHQMNINTAAFPPEEFDLVVNHAAAHHISMIDRVFREICRLLPEDGCFLSMDYVGPHRNQYTLRRGSGRGASTTSCRRRCARSMTYPDLPTMLHDDPTEAIHSELIVETLHRYFHVERFVPLGGAIAYPLLTHNERLFGLTDGSEQTIWVEHVLRADEDFLTEHPDSMLFAYFVGEAEQGGARTARCAGGVGSRKRRDREERARGERRGVLHDAQRSKMRTPASWPRRWSRQGCVKRSPTCEVRSMRCERDPLVSGLTRLRASSPFPALREQSGCPSSLRAGAAIGPPADIRYATVLIPLPRPVIRTV